MTFSVENYVLMKKLFDSLQTQIDNLILNDGTGNAEVEQARGDFNLLYKRFDDIDNKMSNKANAIDLDGHILNKNNPHNVSKDDVGLRNVTNEKQLTESEFNVFLNSYNSSVQKNKLTKDNMNAKDIPSHITSLRDLTEPGIYYMTTSQTGNFIDHPDPNNSGYYLQVWRGSSDTNAVQMLIRVTSGEPYVFLRTFWNAGISGWWKLDMKNA